MGVVADKGIGAGINETMCLHTLGGNGFGLMFSPPMQANNDGTARITAFQALNGCAKCVDGKLTDTWTVRQVGIVFECHLNGSEQKDLSRTFQ